MKRIILITILIAGLSTAYGFAQMSQGHMMNQGMMGGQSQQPVGTQNESGYYPCPQMMGPGMTGGMMGPGMMGPGMMGYGGYGMQGTDPGAYQKYLNDTAELRKKLHDKKFEFFEEARKPGVNRESVMKLEKEILDLQWELYEKAPR
ncbi:MAG: hypothetical protein AB1499_00715 [Nitrospirota bacterium]